MLSLLMTRPRAASERFVALLPTALRDRITPVYAPLIGIEPVAGRIACENARGVIFTSANGVAMAGRLGGPGTLPCFCVGQETTRAAQRAGWQAQFAGVNADALIETLTRQRPDAPLLHLRGAHARGDIAGRLTAAGLQTREQAIYDQRLLPLTDEAARLLDGDGPVIVPVFSPRTARHFADLHEGAAPLFLAAISAAAAEPLEILRCSALIVAERPDAAAMAVAVEKLATQASRLEGATDAQ